GLLLVASLLFYAWGGKQFVEVIVIGVIFNYWMGLLIGYRRKTAAGRRMLTVAVVGNLALLVAFKYSRFIVANLNLALLGLKHEPIALPDLLVRLGISFFVFPAIGYVVDVYKGDALAERSFASLALYLLFFPKIVAGPITRYAPMAPQLGDRSV